MLDKVPREILLNIMEKVSIKDMLFIRGTCNVLKTNVDAVSGYIVRTYLKQQNLSTNVLEQLDAYIYRVVRYHSYEKEHYRYIEDSIVFGKVYAPLVNHFIRCGTLSSFSNKILIYIAFVLGQMQFYNSALKQHHHSFLKHLGDSQYVQFMRFTYYTGLLKMHCPYDENVNRNYISISMLHEVSTHVVTVSTLSKLFAIKILDLGKASLVPCCDFCYNNDLGNIVLYKFNRPQDELLSYNYLQIKNFFRNCNQSLYHSMCEYELVLINKMITYINPFNGRRLRVNNRVSNRFMYWLMFEKYNSPGHLNTYNTLVNYIRRRQTELLHQFFD